jgi:hypothetical protein
MKRSLKRFVKRSILLKYVLTDLPWVTVVDFISPNKLVQEITPAVYQTWESNDFGRRHAKEINKFRALNPGLNFYLYNKEQRDAYMVKSWGNRPIYLAYKNAKFGQIKADIFRYCIVFEFGGYYFDISKGCSVPLNTLHSPSSIGLLANESNDRKIPVSPELLEIYSEPKKLFVQWAFGFAPQNQILGTAIKLIEENIDSFQNKEFKNPSAAILDFSATHLFTRAVDEYALVHGLNKVSQSGIDFNHHGIFSLNGSSARYLQVPSYKLARASSLIKADDLT